MAKKIKNKKVVVKKAKAKIKIKVKAKKINKIIKVAAPVVVKMSDAERKELIKKFVQEIRAI